MAGTYYKYAEQNADSYIDWSQVGKDLTDSLKKEVEIREQKKAAIDKATRESMDTLANQEQGEHRGINSFWLTYADNAQSAILMQDRLLKSGRLKLKDYNIMRQNLTDGTKQAINLVNDYQAEYKDKMERYRKGDSAALEQWLMAEAEAFSNFNNSDLYIDPTTFTVNVAKKEKKVIDGKEVYTMSENPNNFTTVAAMRNRIKGKFDKFNVALNLEAGVKSLGKEIQAIKQYGKITEISDITKRKDFGVEAKSAVTLFERAEDAYLDSLMVRPTDTGSILTDYVGLDPNTKKPYTFTFDPKEAGGNMILVKNDDIGRPTLEFTDEQKKVAKNALREKFRVMLDREESIKAVTEPQPQQWQAQQREKKVALEEEGKIIAEMFGGDAAQVQAAVDHFNGLSNVSSVNRDAEKLTVRFKDGTVKEVKVAGSTKEGFVKAASKLLLGDEADVSKVLSGASRVSYTSPSSSTGASTSQGKEDPFKVYGDYISSITPQKIFSVDNSSEEDVAKNITKSLAKLGYSARVPWTSGNYIVVKSPDGTESDEISLDDAQGARDAVQAFLINTVPGKDEVEKAVYISGLIKKGLISGGGTSSSQTTTVSGGTTR